MKQEPTLKELLPRGLTRLLFYSFICWFVYQETGIVTTFLLGLLIIETALRGDVLSIMGKVQNEMADALKDVLEFQNDYINKRMNKEQD